MRKSGIANGRLRVALAAAALAAGISGATTAEAQTSPDDADLGAASEPGAAESEPSPDDRDGLDAVDADDTQGEAAVPAPGGNEDERALWERRANEARARVVKARARVKAAQEAYQSMRQRNYPRGEAKDAILHEVEASKKALADAEARLERLGVSAREADVPPAWIEQD